MEAYEELGKDAASAPNIDTGVVILFHKYDFRWTVISRGHVIGKSAWLFGTFSSFRYKFLSN